MFSILSSSYLQSPNKNLNPIISHKIPNKSTFYPNHHLTLKPKIKSPYNNKNDRTEPFPFPVPRPQRPRRRKIASLGKSCQRAISDRTLNPKAPREQI